MSIFTVDTGQGKTDPGVPKDFFLLGDSTTASNNGWGDYLEDQLFPSATVLNRALSGRSSKSFYNEVAAWDDTKNDSIPQLSGNPGSFVLIQFGHNDISVDPLVGTLPMGASPDYLGEFMTFMGLYLSEIVALGSTPVLVTPLSRIRFTGASHDRTHESVSPFYNFPAAIKKLGADNGVEVIDLEQRSHDEYETQGEAWCLVNIAKNGTDRSHLSPGGGVIVAGWVADEIDKIGSGNLWEYVP